MNLGLLLAVSVVLPQSPAAPISAQGDIPSPAPQLIGGPWLNTKDGQPVTWESRRGKPTLVAFWTFACSNCQANIQPYARLLAKYRPRGVEMISIHTPELPVERQLAKVEAHVRQFKIDYPVLIDNDGRNWNRWNVDSWPTLFVVDAHGKIRYHWVGELNYGGLPGEAKIGEALDLLLAETPSAKRAPAPEPTLTPPPR